MTNVTINGESYAIKSDWCDFTIADAKKLYRVINSLMPEKLSEFYNAKTQKEREAVKGSTDDYVKNFPEFYGKMICELSDIPEDIMEMCLAGERLHIYKQLVEHIVEGLLLIPRDVPPIEGFVRNEVVYSLPLSEEEPGNLKIGAYMTAIEFTEAADLQRFSSELDGGMYERASEVIAILCRPEGEKYDEDVSRERAKEFEDLTMDICYGVFFSLITSMNTYIQDTVISSLPLGSSLREQVERLISISSGGVVQSSNYVKVITHA